MPEDFRVDEIAAYPLSGQGPHTFLLVEKRGRDTREVVRELAKRFRVPGPEVGFAGQKDRQALTTQWISVPAVDPSAALVEGEGFRVLEATRHGNKLRTGHLRGNRFTIVVRGADTARARALADALRARGLPNAYGDQRFGRGGDNQELGRRLLLGERLPRVDRTTARLYVSAFQSFVFNEVLARRVGDGTWVTPLAGDVLEKAENGAKFVCEDPAADAPRVQSFACSVTGPMPGGKVRPRPGGAPAELEAEVLARTGVTEEHLRRARDAEGARRALRIPVDVAVEPHEAGVTLAFALPSGSYATRVLAEIAR